MSERLHARRLVRGGGDDQAEHRIGALGSGSDYTPFLQQLGIASLNLSYSGEGGGGSYHSIFDSFDHYTRFSDPTFEYGIALAQTAGRAVLRLSEAEVLPFEFTRFSATVSRYVDEITALTDHMRDATERQNRLIRDKRYEAAADPTETYVPPKPKEPVPHLNFAPLQNAVVGLEESARQYGEAMRTLEASGRELSPSDRQSLDQILTKTERALTRDEGFPRRPWFTHHIYAPGFYTGYGVKTLPGVREAIEERKWQEAGEQVEIAAEIDRATAVLSGSSGK